MRDEVRGGASRTASEQRLALLSSAERALAEVRTLQEAKDVQDKAEAIRRYAKQAGLGLDVQNDAAELKILAQRKLGELIPEQFPHGGDRRSGSRSPEVTLKTLGITRMQSHRSQQIFAIPEPTLRAHIAAVRESRKELTTASVVGLLKREAKEALIRAIDAELPPLPEGPFRVVAIDPPWPYGARASDVSHRARNPYPDMDVEDIAAVRVADLAHEDAIVWLWVTNAFMREAYTCLDAWGFEVKTILTWDKVNLGLGDWLRNVTEHCLLAVRGRPVVQLTNQTTLISEPRRGHSQKPEAFYKLVESLCPGSKVELFARQRRPGWVAWGAEADKFGGDDNFRGGRLRGSEVPEVDVAQTEPHPPAPASRRRAIVK